MPSPNDAFVTARYGNRCQLLYTGCNLTAQTIDKALITDPLMKALRKDVGSADAWLPMCNNCHAKQVALMDQGVSNPTPRPGILSWVDDLGNAIMKFLGLVP